MFDSAPGEWSFVQTCPSSLIGTPREFHSHTYVYRAFIYSGRDRRRERFKYIVRGEYHAEEGKDAAIAVKFYLARHRGLSDRYSRLTDAGRPLVVLSTVLSITKDLLARCPGSSFCFMGVPRITVNRAYTEDYKKNIRYRVYEDFVVQKVGNELFSHVRIVEFSSYILLNKKSSLTKEDVLYGMADCYPQISFWLQSAL